MAGAVGQQEVEDAEQGDFGDVAGLIEYEIDQEEDLLDARFVLVDDVRGEVDGEIAVFPPVLVSSSVHQVLPGLNTRFES